MAITPIIEPTTSLNNARIGYKNLLTATTTVDARKMLIPNTYERYPIQSGSTSVKFQLSAPSEINFLGFAAHNLGSFEGGIPIEVKYATTIGGALTSIYSNTFPNDGAVMVLLDNLEGVLVAELEVSFTTVIFGAKIGVFYAGNALEMQRSIYGGHSPADLSAKTKYQSTMSDGGQFLGRTVTSKGSATTFSWRHLTPVWYRESFQLFVDSAVTIPFFITWKPSDYPLATSFGYTDNGIKPSNMGGGSDLMAVSFNFTGHSD
jgi:hypothetical protein